MDTGLHVPEACDTPSLYYQAVRINISISGEYAFSSDAGIVTYAYLYSDVFYPFRPSRNLIASDNDGCGVGRFWLRYSLHANTTYVLVLRYLKSEMPLLFSIVSTGIARVNLTKLGKCSCAGATAQMKFVQSRLSSSATISGDVDLHSRTGEE
jgi:hypothetical protein